VDVYIAHVMHRPDLIRHWVMYARTEELRAENSRCFVVTAVYRSEDRAPVRALRLFRDSVLARHTTGRALIWAYAKVGPRIAAYVAEREWARRRCRALFAKTTRILRRNGHHRCSRPSRTTDAP
jgi:hypothetical protein